MIEKKIISSISYSIKIIVAFGLLYWLYSSGKLNLSPLTTLLQRPLVIIVSVTFFFIPNFSRRFSLENVNRMPEPKKNFNSVNF